MHCLFIFLGEIPKREFCIKEYMYFKGVLTHVTKMHFPHLISYYWSVANNPSLASSFKWKEFITGYLVLMIFGGLEGLSLTQPVGNQVGSRISLLCHDRASSGAGLGSGWIKRLLRPVLITSTRLPTLPKGACQGHRALSPGVVEGRRSQFTSLYHRCILS